MAENTNTNNTFHKEVESSFQLADLWHLVWDHKWWYVLAVGIAVFVAAFYLYPRYVPGFKFSLRPSHCEKLD